MAQTNIALPTSEQPLVDVDDKGITTGFPTVQWYQFWRALLTRTQATVPFTVETAISATGTTVADAFQLTAEWNEIGTAPLNSGVILENFGPGTDSRVWNDGAHPVKIYAPSGCTIDGGASYTLNNAKAQVFSQLDDTTFKSLQLG